MNGYIKLFRKLTEWRWYKNLKTFKAFVHCLLEANYTDKNYEDQVIPRGSFLTGRKKFGDECGLTEQETRSAWTNLKSTNEITIISTNKGTLITVVKYEEYQPLVDIVTNDLTNKQPTNNQQITTTNNINNINNSVCNIICHLGLEEKFESCKDCRKNKVCNNPTSNQFLFEHNGLSFEEWMMQREALLSDFLNSEKPEEELFDYNWLEDSDEQKHKIR